VSSARRWVRWGRSRAVAVGGLVALTTAVVIVPSHAAGARGRPALGTFAGYVSSRTRLRTVEGSWTVPRIAKTAHDGLASTWIGAQGPGASAKAPFIQIGTTDERHTDSRLGPRDSYEAFWSDIQRQFKPQGLFAVDPGDRVSASLVLCRGRWRVQRIRRAVGAPGFEPITT
jgi:hypothetical protein